MSAPAVPLSSAVLDQAASLDTFVVEDDDPEAFYAPREAPQPGDAAVFDPRLGARLHEQRERTKIERCAYEPHEVRDCEALTPPPRPKPAPPSPPPDGDLTREQIRSRRKREVRARTISTKRMPQRELVIGLLMYPEMPGKDYHRPKDRSDCREGVRPCPYVSCQFHLYLDVSWRTGAIKLNFPDLDVWEMNETCALDVADRGGTTLEDVGAIMNLTRERVRQVEIKAMAWLERFTDLEVLREFLDDDGYKRRLPVLRDLHDEDGDDLDEEIEAAEEDAGEDDREDQTLEREFIDHDTSTENAADEESEEAT